MSSLYQINTNIDALNAFSSLNQTNQEMGERRLRLATGNRINKAEDDSAGYSIAKKLEAKTRGQAQALQNMSDAKAMLTVAEGGMNSIMDILQTMKEKAVQAANDTMGTDERQAIQNQLTELSKEVDDIADDAEFNGKKLLDGTGGTLTFQVGASSSSTFDVAIADLNAAGTLSVATSDLNVTGGAGSIAATIQNIDDSIKAVATELGNLGDKQKRLSFKSENLDTARTNYESARSGIMDADFAKEQMQISKLQILQQTGTATLAQANAGAQSVLSLLG